MKKIKAGHVLVAISLILCLWLVIGALANDSLMPLIPVAGIVLGWVWWLR